MGDDWHGANAIALATMVEPYAGIFCTSTQTLIRTSAVRPNSTHMVLS